MSSLSYTWSSKTILPPYMYLQRTFWNVSRWRPWNTDPRPLGVVPDTAWRQLDTFFLSQYYTLCHFTSFVCLNLTRLFVNENVHRTLNCSWKKLLQNHSIAKTEFSTPNCWIDIFFNSKINTDMFIFGSTSFLCRWINIKVSTHTAQIQTLMAVTKSKVILILQIIPTE